MKWSNYGNRFLLDRPVLVPVRVSRRATAKDLESIKTEIMREVAGAAVVVSPFISQGEKDIANMVLGMEHGAVILMNHNGFAPHYRPGGKYFKLCAKGNLLILSTFPPETRNEPFTKNLCEQINAWCRTMAETEATARV